MKKLITFVFALICIASLFACSNQPPTRTETIESGLNTYHKLSDGTWECDGHTYKYRLEITGTMPNAKASSTFVYLSNIENISFERAYKAAGISSYLGDYFAAEDAVLVDWITN